LRIWSISLATRSTTSLKIGFRNVPFINSSRDKNPIFHFLSVLPGFKNDSMVFQRLDGTFQRKDEQGAALL
jgi:hypothetical protein